MGCRMSTKWIFPMTLFLGSVMTNGCSRIESFSKTPAGPSGVHATERRVEDVGGEVGTCVGSCPPQTQAFTLSVMAANGDTLSGTCIESFPPSGPTPLDCPLNGTGRFDGATLLRAEFSEPSPNDEI